MPETQSSNKRYAVLISFCDTEPLAAPYRIFSPGNMNFSDSQGGRGYLKLLTADVCTGIGFVETIEEARDEVDVILQQHEMLLKGQLTTLSGYSLDGDHVSVPGEYIRNAIWNLEILEFTMEENDE